MTPEKEKHFMFLFREYKELFHKKNRTEEDNNHIDKNYDEMTSLQYLEIIKEKLLDEQNDLLWEEYFLLYQNMPTHIKNQTYLEQEFSRKLIKSNMNEEKRILLIVKELRYQKRENLLTMKKEIEEVWKRYNSNKKITSCVDEIKLTMSTLDKKQEFNLLFKKFKRIMNTKKQSIDDSTKLDVLMDGLSQKKYFDLLKENIIVEDDFYIWRKLVIIYFNLLFDFVEAGEKYDYEFVKQLIQENINNKDRIEVFLECFYMEDQEHLQNFKKEIDKLWEKYSNDSYLKKMIMQMKKEIN